MRCLYCGKELALLKRWTSGGEFCSDAHRQQYQEEYNQLALNRLLQAKPQAKTEEPKPQEPRHETKAPEVKAQEIKVKPEPKLQENAAPRPLPPAEPERPATRPAPLPEPKLEPEPQPAAETLKEEPAPAEAGFFIELPVPLLAGTAELVVAETDFERHHKPMLPYLHEASEAGQWRTELVAAAQIALVPSFVLADSPARVSEGKLELREFVRPAPAVDFDLRAAGMTGISEKSEEPMDMIIFPQPPPGEPPLWREGERSFPFETELGTLARMAFRTTGIEDNEDGEVALPLQEAAPVENVAPAPASPPLPVNNATEAPAAKAPQPVPVRVNEPSRPATPVIMKPASPPVFRQAVRPAAQASPAAQARVAQAPAAPAMQAPAAKAKSEPIPEAPAKPLPVTLHGLAAGRGKPVQVFASAVAADVDLQLPRSSALPLRPVMTLGAAPAMAKEMAVKEAKEERKPAERTVTVKADPRRQPSRPEPRFSNGKGRKPEPEPQREKFEEPKVAAVATAVKDPEPVQVKEPPKEPPKEKFTPPPPKPFAPADLDLPSLTLDTGGGFWGKLPIAGKAGIGVVGVLAIAGIVFALSRGSNPKPMSQGPQIVEGPALSAVESGWITDWGAEPGVRREHEISVLRPSLNLTDYRLQFEAQIDTKALGWVYRAQDGKNYYVNKLEIVKPGLQPTIALVRFAVINGLEQPRAQFPLTLAVHLDTLYKIRFDAVGDRFITYVQDQKVDEWTDERLKMGGVGLYNERSERMSLKGTVNVVPLVIKK